MTAVRAATYAPDGTEITYERDSVWDTAGLAKRTAGGQWVELAHGTSPQSVRSRALTRAYRTGYYDTWTVQTAPIYEATAQIVRDYFGHHAVKITQVFRPGRGWESVSLAGGRSVIRKLSKQGVTSVGFEARRNIPEPLVRAHLGPAEFGMEYLLKSLRLPKQQFCNTRGHEHLPATHKISYQFKGDEPRTELVCGDCAEITGSAGPGLLASFDSTPLAA